MERHDGPFQVVRWPANSSYYDFVQRGNVLKPGIVYVESDEDKIPERLHFICPCGKCYTRVELNLVEEYKRDDPSIPCWQFTEINGYADINPSIWRDGRKGCHFFVKMDGVKWV